MRFARVVKSFISVFDLLCVLRLCANTCFSQDDPFFPLCWRTASLTIPPASSPETIVGYAAPRRIRVPLAETILLFFQQIAPGNGFALLEGHYANERRCRYAVREVQERQ
jgi:hypothetical protein